MAVVATGSRHKRNSNWMIAAACIAFALWFLYDGWVNKDFQKEKMEQGKQLDLQANRYYVPIACAALAVYFAISAVRTKGLRAAADEQGLLLADGTRIGYDAIEKIDKRFFDQEGHFTVSYRSGAQERRLRLSDRDYDQLGLVLDEIVQRTGAAPASAESPPEQRGSNGGA